MTPFRHDGAAARAYARRRRLDAAEALANPIIGAAVSVALVETLRALGAWDAPSPAVAAVFFAAGWVRAYGLRRLFRRLGA